MISRNTSLTRKIRPTLWQDGDTDIKKEGSTFDLSVANIPTYINRVTYERILKKYDSWIEIKLKKEER
jgi:hypothetical protein